MLQYEYNYGNMIVCRRLQMQLSDFFVWYGYSTVDSLDYPLYRIVPETRYSTVPDSTLRIGRRLESMPPVDPSTNLVQQQSTL